MDPELVPALDIFTPPLDVSASGLAGTRQRIAELTTASMLNLPASVLVEERMIPALIESPPVRAVIYRPVRALASMPAVLHIHGGGYVLGSPELAAGAQCALVDALGCIVVSVDYRLAPETAYPGSVEDCYCALRWLHSNAAGLGVDVRRIGVSGESAGGGLAAALALLARDRGEVPLAFQHLIYPMIDDRTCIDSEPHTFTGEFVWTRSQNRLGWQSLLGAMEVGSAAVPAYAAASRAKDLAGLPPTFICVGALDLFLEENLDYARRLLRAGIPTELHVYPGAIHGFQMASSASVSVAAERDSLNALRRFMRVSQTA